LEIYWPLDLHATRSVINLNFGLQGVIYIVLIFTILQVNVVFIKYVKINSIYRYYHQ